MLPFALLGLALTPTGSTLIPAAAAAATTNMASVASTLPFLIQGCGQLAPFASIAVFLAPLPTFRQISKDKSVGSLPLLPYSSMVSSAFVWVTYGILQQESKVWITNAVGLALSLYYLSEFIKYAPKRAPTFPGSIVGHLQVCATLVLVTLGIALTMSKPAALVGNLGVLLCVAMFGSPLAALRTVLTTKSAESIPLPFTMASVLNCFLWTVVGFFDMKDVNIYLPNALGLMFGLIQVVLKFIYGNGKGGKSGVVLPL